MTQKAETRDPGEGTRASNCFLLAGWNGSENRGTALEIQVRRLMRSMGLSRPVAHAIAELAYYGGPAR